MCFNAWEKYYKVQVMKQFDYLMEYFTSYAGINGQNEINESVKTKMF